MRVFACALVREMVAQGGDQERAESAALRGQLAEVALLEQAREETLHRVGGFVRIEPAAPKERVQRRPILLTQLAERASSARLVASGKRGDHAPTRGEKRCGRSGFGSRHSTWLYRPHSFVAGPEPRGYRLGMERTRRGSKRETLLLASLALFTGFFVAANFLGNKLWEFTLFGLAPNDLGLEDESFVATAGILAFPLTFILTDVVNEYFGKRVVRTFTWLAIAVNVVLQPIVVGAVAAPTVSLTAGIDSA
ncbi:MAG: VUT family protein, partial [Planctomycetes bacterium]|nr:VUT family protein [Planctomycetota bacterium]